MNGEGAVSRAPEDVPTSASSIALRTDNYPVTGTLVIDLRDHETHWPEPSPIRYALSAIEQLPRGAHVRVFVGRVAFHSFYISDLELDHVAITVESNDVARIREWVHGLREACA